MHYSKWMEVQLSTSLSCTLRFSHQITFEEERRAQAKDAVLKGEDYYDIYDPRNSINKRRRNADSANKPRQPKH